MAAAVRFGSRPSRSRSSRRRAGGIAPNVCLRTSVRRRGRVPTFVSFRSLRFVERQQEDAWREPRATDGPRECRCTGSVPVDRPVRAKVKSLLERWRGMDPPAALLIRKVQGWRRRMIPVLRATTLVPSRSPCAPRAAFCFARRHDRADQRGRKGHRCDVRSFEGGGPEGSQERFAQRPLPGSWRRVSAITGEQRGAEWDS
jgi:hypothetical protein